MKERSLAKDARKWQGSPESIAYKPGKGAYIVLVSLSVFALAFIGYFLWYIPTVGLRNIHPALPVVLGIILFTIAVFIIGSGAILVFATLKGRVPFYSKWLRWLIMKLYLPIMVMAGGLLRIPKMEIEKTFIQLNNQLVKMMGRRFRPEKLLILMPHCIQFDNCKIKVTRNVRNCAGCGKCEIGELVSLMEEFKVSLFISTGGTVARRKVYEDRPDVVLAVACERDLASGLQDAYPLPVLAIVNKRPRGYCMETGVAIEDVRQGLSDLLGRAPAH